MTVRAESIRVMCPLFQAGEGGSIPTSALQLWIYRISTERALAMNRLWHSRLPRFGCGVENKIKCQCFAAVGPDEMTYAVALWSNPAARRLPQYEWLELRRLAIAPDAPRNTASRMLRIMAMLIGRQMPNISRLITYQDKEVHTGCIYQAAGWSKTTITPGGTGWDMPSRPRPSVPNAHAAKQRWELVL